MLKSPKLPVALYFDPGTHHFLQDRLFDRGFAAHCGDQILAPFAHMKEYLNARGVEVHTADFFPKKQDHIRKIYVTAGRTGYKHLVHREDTVLSAYFAFECPTVEPGMYKELNNAQHRIKRIYSWSDSASLEPFVGGPLRCLPMRWPQSFDTVHEGVWGRVDRKFLVVLNGNKRLRYEAKHCRELYSERLRAIEYFARTEAIDLYGIGWDRPPMIVGRAFVPGTFGSIPLPGIVQRVTTAVVAQWHRFFPDPQLAAAKRVYKGFVSSKASTLGAYTFCLCFENSILKGWVTEKIFDCFFAGTVPVYWGAPDIEEYVPEDCFIDMREFADYRELDQHLRTMPRTEIERHREAAREFVQSPRFYPFTKQAFAKLFGEIIAEDAGVVLDDLKVAHV